MTHLPLLADRACPPAVSWLALLHPDGAAPRAEVRPAARGETPSPSDSIDLSLVAATSRQAEESGWLDHELERLTHRLAAEGVGYVAVPRRWRRSAARIATRLGLAVGPWFLQLPPLPATRYLIPVDRRALRSAFGVIVPGHRWTRRLLPIVLALGAQRTLPVLMPSAGFVVRRPGARPVFDWLFRLEDRHDRIPADPRGTAIVALSWQDPRGRAVLHGFRGGEPERGIVAKVKAEPPPGDDAAAEMSSLARFGPDAERAGATIPRPLGLSTVAGRQVLLESAVPGRPAADLLASDARRLGDVAERLTTWLARWHALTRVDSADHQALERLVLGRLDHLQPLLSDGDSYRGWLAVRSAAALPQRLSLTAAHNDLTMWNVLVGGDKLGIVDWEHATAGSLPLSDAFYAIVDAVVACGVEGGRLAALQACLPPTGPHAALAIGLWSRLARALAIPDEIVTLSFHACWIQHAVNEATARADAPGPRPFLEIVRWLARTRANPGALAIR